MSEHFEQLWETAENFHKQKDSDIEVIVNQLLLKINLYKTVTRQEAKTPEEIEKIKSHLMGEILFSLTHLSFKENIDVYKSLKEVLYFANIENHQKDHSSFLP